LVNIATAAGKTLKPVSAENAMTAQIVKTEIGYNDGAKIVLVRKPRQYMQDGYMSTSNICFTATNAHFK